MGQPNLASSPPGTPWLVLLGTPILVFLLLSQLSVQAGGGKGGKQQDAARGTLQRPLWDPCWKCQASKIGLASISTKPRPLTRGAPPFQREPRRDLASCPFSRPLIRFVLQLTLHRKAWERVRFGRLGARQSNRLVISPSVVGTGVALGSPHWHWDPGDFRSVPSASLGLLMVSAILLWTY